MMAYYVVKKRFISNEYNYLYKHELIDSGAKINKQIMQRTQNSNFSYFVLLIAHLIKRIYTTISPIKSLTVFSKLPKSG